MTFISDRINKIAQHIGAKRYLEIGVSKGNTFFNVDIPYKVGVDPFFRFSPVPQVETHFFFSMRSETFFNTYPSSPAAQVIAAPFDIIFIDGLHTYQQSYKDFIQSMALSHDKTIWIIDDTVPNDAFSAVPDMSLCYKYREAAGLMGGEWHGDVYKTLFAIHDEHPEFSYCTVIDAGNPQTVLWKVDGLKEKRKKIFADINDIAKLSYTDIISLSQYMILLPERHIPDILYSHVTPTLSTEESMKRFFYRKARVFDEQKIAELYEQIDQLTREVTKLRD